MWRDPSVTAAQAAFVLEPTSVSHAVVLLYFRSAVVRLSFGFAVVLFSVMLFWFVHYVCSLVWFLCLLFLFRFCFMCFIVSCFVLFLSLYGFVFVFLCVFSRSLCLLFA